MSDDDFEDEGARAGGGDRLAAHIALGNGAAAEEARQYLREQTELARLQKLNLIEQNAFELSHLRWRRFNDQMKGAMQIMLVAVGLLIVVAIAAAMWNASQADGLAVDSFSVPPQLVAAGMDGDTVASDLTNRIGTIRDIANDNSLDASQDVHDSRNDIKVEIPNTGISLTEVWRYLKLWLGHERRMNGYLRLKGPDKIALTVALDGARSITLEGPSADLDKLEQQAAERIFATVDPVNYVLYLEGTKRSAEALAQAARAVNLVTTAVARADAYALWSYETRNVTGNIALAEARIALSIATDPRSAPAHVEMIRDGVLMGHDEEALDAARALQTIRREDQVPAMQGNGFTEILYEAANERDAATGDYRQGMAEPCPFCSPADSVPIQAEYAARAHDVTASRALLVRAGVLGGAAPLGLDRARYYGYAATGAWQAAVADMRAYSAVLGTSSNFANVTRAMTARTRALPMLAEAEARSGDIAAARATIAPSPRDCYNCVRVRGIVEALTKNWNGAAYWFADAVKQGPSLPFAYTDWGAALLSRGQYDAAIAKFTAANAKGPHFADPLEMWGEALMQKNRSDLSITKFSEAAQYAPSWGRLHLKWGQALSYTGDHIGAQKQFLIAAKLDLTPSEKTSLEHWIKHG